jgi:lysozyme family protein
MTASNLPAVLKLVLVHEGGYVNHPKDPGGATMKGVTQAVYDAYRIRHDQPKQTVKKITNAELEAIYRDQYWRTIHADEMPKGVDYCLFDYAVNSGAGRAVKDLQRALGVKVDGIVGMGTLTALGLADDARLINDVCDRRLRFLKSLKTWRTFGRGWASRVAGVRSAALAMVEGEPPMEVAKAAPAPLARPAPKAPEAAQAQLKTAEGAGLSLTAAGAGGEKVRQFAESVQPHMGMETMLGRLAFAIFTLLMLIGGSLIGYAYLRRIKEKGGLGGFLGSVFKEAT